MYEPQGYKELCSWSPIEGSQRLLPSPEKIVSRRNQPTFRSPADQEAGSALSPDNQFSKASVGIFSTRRESVRWHARISASFLKLPCRERPPSVDKPSIRKMISRYCPGSSYFLIRPVLTVVTSLGHRLLQCFAAPAQSDDRQQSQGQVHRKTNLRTALSLTVS